MAVSSKPDTVWWFVYGADLMPQLLKQRLGPHKPLQQRSCFVPGAYMSFDARGVPWLAPCLATLIVEGVNDQDFTAAREAEASTKEKSGAYDEWLWSRCAPGLDFAGERPPTVEGLAFELSQEAWAHVCEASIGAGLTALPLHATTFDRADRANVTGSLDVRTLLRPRERGRLGAHMQPTRAYLFCLLRPAYLQPLSQTFIGFLCLLRPFTIDSIASRIGKSLVSLIVLPSYLCFTLPAHLLRRAGASQLASWWHSPKLVDAASKSACEAVEAVFRRFGLASGYHSRIE